MIIKDNKCSDEALILILVPPHLAFYEMFLLGNCISKKNIENFILRQIKHPRYACDLGLF